MLGLVKLEYGPMIAAWLYAWLILCFFITSSLIQFI